MLISDIYKILHSGNIDKSLILFTEYYNNKENKENKIDFLNCILGLGEIYIKRKDFNNANKFYTEGNQLSNGKNFNILFNLGITYSNLGENEKALLFLNKAKIINPDNEKLNIFIKNINNSKNIHLKDIYEFEDDNGNKKLQIVFRLTLNCNQRCIFCNVVSGKNNIEKNILFENIKIDILSIINKYKNIPKQNIELVLSGGEPTLHDDFWNIIDFVLAKAGKVTIQTNGVIFNEKYFINLLRERKKQNISFYISFHSHVENLYNKITQTNQYDKAVSGIKNILSTTNNEIEFNFVFNNYNINTFFGYLLFLRNTFFKFNDILLNKHISLKISAITGVNDKELLIKYSDILNDIYGINNSFIEESKIFLSGLIPGGAMCDIPFCVYQKYINLELELELKNKKLFIVNKIDINNIKLNGCEKCKLNKNCPGILKAYLEKFGEGEFVPIL